MYPAGNGNQLWKLKEEKDLFAKILLVAHRLKGRAGEPGLEPRQIGGGGEGVYLGCLNAGTTQFSCWHE